MIRGFCRAHDDNPTLFRFLLFVQHGQLGKLAPGTPTPVEVMRTVLDSAIASREIPRRRPIWRRPSSSASCCSRSRLLPTDDCLSIWARCVNV